MYIYVYCVSRITEVAAIYYNIVLRVEIFCLL